MVEKYNRNLEDIFAVQSEIAQKVANGARSTDHRGEKLTSPESNDSKEAYMLYLEAATS